MSKLYADFEEVVYKKLAAHFDEVIAREGAEILGKGYGSRNKLLGHSGIKHQIDVHIEYISKDGTHRLKLVECKHLSQRKIDLETVLTFFARMSDIQKDRGDKIIVDGNLFTTVGYTAPAKAFANANNIATNSAHLDKEQGSITFAEGVVIKLATANLSTSGLKASIIT